MACLLAVLCAFICAYDTIPNRGKQGVFSSSSRVHFSLFPLCSKRYFSLFALCSLKTFSGFARGSMGFSLGSLLVRFAVRYKTLCPSCWVSCRRERGSSCRTVCKTMSASSLSSGSWVILIFTAFPLSSKFGSELEKVTPTSKAGNDIGGAGGGGLMQQLRQRCRLICFPVGKLHSHT